MKKIMVIIPAAVLAIGATTMGILANAASAEKPKINVNYMSSFSKDNEQTAEKSSASVVNSQAGSRSNFIDSDNDGICDNYTDGVCPQNGMGNGYHHGNGNFVDENNDGICDNYANGVRPQNGTGNGYHRGNGCGRGRTGV